MNVENVNTDSKFKNFIDAIGTIDTIRGLLGIIFLILAFFVCLFVFTRRINKATTSQINRFKNEGKYLPSVFIELNNSTEYLRYLIFSYKWKSRIIKQYNHLFCGFEGKRLKQLLGPTLKYRLSPLTSFSQLCASLCVMHDSLNQLKENRKKLHDKHGELVWAITNSTYKHILAIQHMQDLCSLIQEKNIVVVGSAGNGKTSLLCRIADLAIANKIPCMLINARDIKEDCTEYVLNKLPLISGLRNAAKIYLRLVCITLFFRRKYFYIFIDAINENDREIFAKSISPLLANFSKYRRIRILMSCRSEYFDTRYKTLFSSREEKPYIFNLQNTKYDKRATTKMIRAYMKHFNVHGPFSPEMQNKLLNSLFLTRIFFEVNGNLDQCMLEFRNAEIYKLYFKKIEDENTGIKLSDIINNMAQYMFSKFQFDKMPIEELHLSHDDLTSLRKLLDNNLIISHTVYAGKGITEREKEYVYFVFDELRDFCLARYLLSLDEDNSSEEYNNFFFNVTKLFAERLSPVEGMVKYAYHHFKISDKSNLCEKILKVYGESDVQSILERQNHNLRRQRTFSNFGLSLIFSEGNNAASYELDYILHCIKTDCSYFWEVFWFLLENEHSGFMPNTQLALDLMICCDSDETCEKILNYFFADKTQKYFYSKTVRRINNLSAWLDAIEQENGDLSKSLKIFVIILSAYEPYELSLREYYNVVADKELFEEIQQGSFCNKIKLLVSNLINQRTHKITHTDDLQTLLEILKSEGYCD